MSVQAKKWSRLLVLSLFVSLGTVYGSDSDSDGEEFEDLQDRVAGIGTGLPSEDGARSVPKNPLISGALGQLAYDGYTRARPAVGAYATAGVNKVAPYARRAGNWADTNARWAGTQMQDGASYVNTTVRAGASNTWEGAQAIPGYAWGKVREAGSWAKWLGQKGLGFADGGMRKVFGDTDGRSGLRGSVKSRRAARRHKENSSYYEDIISISSYESHNITRTSGVKNAVFSCDDAIVTIPLKFVTPKIRRSNSSPTIQFAFEGNATVTPKEKPSWFSWVRSGFRSGSKSVSLGANQIVVQESDSDPDDLSYNIEMYLRRHPALDGKNECRLVTNFVPDEPSNILQNHRNALPGGVKVFENEEEILALTPKSAVTKLYGAVETALDGLVTNRFANWCGRHSL